MKRLLCYLKPYRTACVLGPLLKLMEATLELLVPYIIFSMIYHGIDTGDTDHIVFCTVLLIGFGIIGLLFAVTAQYFAAKAAVGFSSQIREALFSRLLLLSYKDYDSIGQSTMLSRLIGDVDQIQNGVNLALRLLLRSPFIVIGAVIAAFWIDTSAGIVFAVTVPVLAIIVFSIMIGGVPLYRTVQLNLDRVVLKTRENLNGVRPLRAFCREDQEVRSFDRANRQLYEASKTAGRLSALLNPLTYVLINLAIVVLVYIGAIRVKHGSLSQAGVIALYNYMSQILVELIKLANFIIQLTKAIACGRRISDVLDIPVESDAAGMSGMSRLSANDCATKRDGNTPAAVSFSGVDFSYDSASTAVLSDLNFSIPAGSSLGIIGSTGCGKTTLLQLIPGFYRSTSGDISVFGNDISAYRQEELRRMIGFAAQKPSLFHGTIRSNLALGQVEISDDDLWSALRSAQAEDFVKSLPSGLDAPVSFHGHNFSGGQKQRLSIARAIARRPRILILDDCTSGLDYLTDAKLRKAVRSLDFQPTVIISSKRASSVFDCDIILVIDGGKIVGCGTHGELYRKCPVYREICQSQRIDENGEASAA